MRGILLTILLLSGINQLGWAQDAPPSQIYGVELQAWLRQNWYTGYHRTLGYYDARRAMYSYIDKAEDNQVYCVYTEFSQTAQNTTFLNPINAEHTVPQSWFGSAEPMVSDIFHLFPTHKDVNAERGSYPFDDIPDEQTDSWYVAIDNQYSESYSVPSQNIDDYSELDDYTRFEPREQHKGDLARAVFYFYTMYPQQAGNLDRIVYGGLETLYQWHLQDPVSNWELGRNQRIRERQGNQNPYIVYPDLACRAFNFDCQATSAPFLLSTTSLPQFSPVQYQTAPYPVQRYTLRASEANQSVRIESGPHFLLSLSEQGEWGSSLTVVASTEPLDVFVQFRPSKSVQGLIQENIMHSAGDYSVSLLVQGLEGNPNLMPQVIGEENFNNCELAWEVVSLASNKNWECQSGGKSGSGMYINGYGGNQASNDWLISPAWTVEEFVDYSFSGWLYTQYSGPVLKAYYTYDYQVGLGPEAQNWTELPINLPAENSRTWQKFSSQLPGQSGELRLAFQYQSTGTGAGQAAAWQLDELLLSGTSRLAPSFYRTEEFDLTLGKQAVYLLLNQRTEQDISLTLRIKQGQGLLDNGSLKQEYYTGSTIFTLPILAGDSVGKFSLEIINSLEQPENLEYEVLSLNTQVLSKPPNLLLEVPAAKPLGFDDVIKSVNIVSPNPVVGGVLRLTTELPRSATDWIYLLDLNGRTLWKQKLTQSQFILPRQLPPGLYTVFIQSRARTYSQKVIISNQ